MSTQLQGKSLTFENTGTQVNPRRWYAVAVILLPVLLMQLNTFMIQVALPSIQNSLQASFFEAQLIVSGYSLGQAVAILIGGRLGDLYGRKRMLLIGVSGFTLMSALGGAVSDPGQMIAVRIIQGLTAAVTLPQILSMIHVSLLPKEKGLAFGIYGATIGVGFTFGLIMGGFLIDWNWFDLGWRTVFLFNVPFGLLVLMCMPFVSESRGAESRKIDWPGVVLLTIGLFLLVYPVSEGAKRGWPLWTWAALILAVPVLLAFAAVQHRKKKRGGIPLVDLSIFQKRLFPLGLLTVLMLFLGMISFFVVLSYYLQYGLHEDVRTTGLAFLPLGGGYFLTSLLSGRVVRRWGSAVFRTGALVMAVCSFLLIGSLHLDATQFFHIRNILLLLGYGLGLGLVTGPLVNTVLSVVRPQDAGTASGLYNTVTNLGNSLGVALIGLLFSASLRQPLAEAALSDYTRAFSSTLIATGGLSVATFVCLIMLRPQQQV
ncbi:drug resistance transporter, EmrB/QacA subfamily [Cohnella sp. OV330]|uniref:MFS transporter n=1 Tax=Cohnella sp. OV330 TaxID=1855288 RepID=UPI0008E6956F|nr:MFS transporter [Cohnella sp. OV330]SFB42045.1 drug resistance transporter, EmrB/QacA subfamily [Cohnella sp. OV330]